MTITVQLNNEKHRYEATADGQAIGHIEYRVDGDTLDLFHTETDPAQGGKGYGTELVRQTLDQVRAVGKKVVPSCPFVKKFIDEHQEYADLLAH